MNASDWIGIGIIVLVVLGALFGLSQLTRPYDVTAEEFERRAREEPGLLNAGIIGLQKVLEPGVAKAEAVQQDLRQGIYDDEEEADDPPEAGADAGEKEKMSDKL